MDPRARFRTGAYHPIVAGLNLTVSRKLWAVRCGFLCFLIDAHRSPSVPCCFVGNFKSVGQPVASAQRRRPLEGFTALVTES